MRSKVQQRLQRCHLQRTGTEFEIQCDISTVAEPFGRTDLLHCIEG